MNNILNIREVHNVPTIAMEIQIKIKFPILLIMFSLLFAACLATHPIINFVFPALAALTIVGMHRGSLGPNMPCGLMAQVSSSGESDSFVLLAFRTSCVCVCVCLCVCVCVCVCVHVCNMCNGSLRTADCVKPE